MNNVSEVLERLKATDSVFNVLFPSEEIELYIGGGIGCLLNGASIRPTKDFDFIDLEYSAKYMRALNTIGDFDFIDINVSAIAKGFKERSKLIFEGKCISAYVISPEDLIVMKLNRYSDVDISDIKLLLKQSNKALLNSLIESASADLDYPKAREIYEKNYQRFRDEVLDYV